MCVLEGISWIHNGGYHGTYTNCNNCHCKKYIEQYCVEKRKRHAQQNHTSDNEQEIYNIGKYLIRMPRALQTILPNKWKSSTTNDEGEVQLASYRILPLTSKIRVYTNKNTSSLTNITLPAHFWSAAELPYFGYFSIRRCCSQSELHEPYTIRW